MHKVIWICWFQGRGNAPALVNKCIESWQTLNPDWDIRVLDKSNFKRYVDLPDLSNKRITHASLSDIVRILLLKEYGGVWVDATLFCNQPLDAWLPNYMHGGFFAFDKPGPDRPLASWFIAAHEGNYLIERWCAETLRYWSSRESANVYFWFHKLFKSLCESDQAFRNRWEAIPKVSADGPHSVQLAGLYSEKNDQVDWSQPLYKLTYRYDQARTTGKGVLNDLINSVPGANFPTPRNAWLPGLIIRNLQWRVRVNRKIAHLKAAPRPQEEKPGRPMQFASLKVSTENLGDHVQILAGQRLLARMNISPSCYLDRDDDIASGRELGKAAERTGMLLNGWFKTNREEWPPHLRIAPLFIGFHIRQHQCPELLSEESINYYKAHQPIGCRDVHTMELLQNEEVEVFESNCLSLTLPRRCRNDEKRRKIFVVSRDQVIQNYLPEEIGEYEFICHYSGERDFQQNMQRAETLINRYRDEAGLIITTLLHCALPAIAMGIPVVMFFPRNTDAGHQSDQERFSSLKKLIPINHLDEVANVNWSPPSLTVGRTKLEILDSLYELAERWTLPAPSELDWVAPSSELPPPQKGTCHGRNNR